MLRQESHPARENLSIQRPSGNTVVAAVATTQVLDYVIAVRNCVLQFGFAYMNEATWDWRLIKTILTVCHVYDKEENYVAFDKLAPGIESHPIKFLKKAMPDYA